MIGALIGGGGGVESSPNPLNPSNIDSFGRLRVSNPSTLFDSSLITDSQPLLWDTYTVGNGSGAYRSSESSFRLSVGTTNGDVGMRQSKRYFRYQPGKSQLVLMTFCMSSAIANVTKQVGYCDDSDGILLEQIGTTNYITLRSSSLTGEQIAQANWNVDRFDGSGPSKKTLDFTKTQIFFIDMEWLGVGRVRAGFVIDGFYYVAHQFLNANNKTAVYMKRAALPIRYRITNTNNSAGSAYIDQICCTVISEGGHSPEGFTFSANNDITTKTVSTAPVPLISIRRSASNQQVEINPVHLSVIDTSNTRQILIEAFINGNLISGSWESIPLCPNSVVQKETSAISITSGTRIFSAYVGAASTFDISASFRVFKLGYAYSSGVEDVLTIAARTLGGTAPVLAGITWDEIQ